MVWMGCNHNVPTPGSQGTATHALSRCGLTCRKVATKAAVASAVSAAVTQRLRSASVYANAYHVSVSVTLHKEAHRHLIRNVQRQRYLCVCVQLQLSDSLSSIIVLFFANIPSLIDNTNRPKIYHTISYHIYNNFFYICIQ